MIDSSEKKVAVHGPVLNAGELRSSDVFPRPTASPSRFNRTLKELDHPWSHLRASVRSFCELLRDDAGPRLLSRQLGVQMLPARAVASRKRTAGPDASLKQLKGDPVQAELDSAMKRIGELTMQVELLEAKT